MKVKAYTGFGEEHRTLETFEVIDKLPEVGEEYNDDIVTAITEVELDSEQGNDSVYDYKYYAIEKEDAEKNTIEVSVALELKDCYQYRIEAGDLRSYSDSIDELKEDYADFDYAIVNNRTGEVVYRKESEI